MPPPNRIADELFSRPDAALAEARTAYTAAQSKGEVEADRTAMARATRDLRYLSARRASAQLRSRDPDASGVQFGDRLELARDDGRRQAFRIVGEEEADPAAGAISYVAPLARALLGREVGDEVEVAGRTLEVLGFRTG